MDRKYKVGGYVKLAKLWERSKDAAVAYHSSYYAEKFRDDADKRLVGVYTNSAVVDRKPITPAATCAGGTACPTRSSPVRPALLAAAMGSGITAPSMSDCPMSCYRTR